MKYGVTKEMARKWQEVYNNSLKQDKEFMEKLAEDLTDKYTVGFDPYSKDGDVGGVFTVYKNGEIVDFKKEEDERTS